MFHDILILRFHCDIGTTDILKSNLLTAFWVFLRGVLKALNFEMMKTEFDALLCICMLFIFQDYPTEDILTYNYVANQWNRSRIENFLRYLRPDNVK